MFIMLWSLENFVLLYVCTKRCVDADSSKDLVIKPHLELLNLHQSLVIFFPENPIFLNLSMWIIPWGKMIHILFYSTFSWGCWLLAKDCATSWTSWGYNVSSSLPLPLVYSALHCCAMEELVSKILLFWLFNRTCSLWILTSHFQPLICFLM